MCSGLYDSALASGNGLGPSVLVLARARHSYFVSCHDGQVKGTYDSTIIRSYDHLVRVRVVAVVRMAGHGRFLKTPSMARMCWFVLIGRRRRSHGVSRSLHRVLGRSACAVAAGGGRGLANSSAGPLCVPCPVARRGRSPARPLAHNHALVLRLAESYRAQPDQEGAQERD